MIDIPQYIYQCAPQVAQSTMQAIIQTESKGNPLAIGLNGGHKLRYQPLSEVQARSWVKYLEEHNYNFDVGLAQINIKNIHKYGYRAIDALDPCINLKLASNVLKKSYFKARSASRSDNEALVKTISAYNTGNYRSGIYNGYVQKVYRNAWQANYGKSTEIATNRVIQLQNPQRSKSLLYAGPKNGTAASFY
ncbi:MAG: lytic transglycosylase [Burkholderiales bacterium]|jgi:type IV secretion system protein VirB1|nr:lytic transglycosylase [Burkholderiales bacterium]